MIMTAFGLEKRKRLRSRKLSNPLEREQMIFEKILRTILDEDLTRYDVSDWLWFLFNTRHFDFSSTNFESPQIYVAQYETNVLV